MQVDNRSSSVQHCSSDLTVSIAKSFFDDKEFKNGIDQCVRHQWSESFECEGDGDSGVVRVGSVQCFLNEHSLLVSSRRVFLVEKSLQIGRIPVEAVLPCRHTSSAAH